MFALPPRKCLDARVRAAVIEFLESRQYFNATLTPTADTFVRDGSSASTIFGGYAVIESKQSTVNSGSNRQIYLKFDISSVSGTVGGAILKVYGFRSNTNDSTFSIGADGMTDNSWTEAATDWNNKPAVGSSLGTATATNTTSAWISINVTSYIQQAKANNQTTVSLAVVGTAVTNDFFEMSSREGSNPAQLVITTNAPPTVATAASATPSPVTGTTTALSVLGADDGGESNLTYTWSTVSKPTGATNPTFSVNGTNASKATTATFSQAGTYTFLATINDETSTTTSGVNVTVNQTLTSITVTPSSATVGVGNTQQLSASAKDQFGQALTSQPTFTWTVPTGAGSVSSAGLYTPSNAAGSATVRATSGGFNGSASITVTNAAPTVATVAAISPNPVTGSTGNLTVLGADDGGESNLTYTWSTTSKPTGAANPTFSVNGTNASKNTVATFTQTGNYTLLATISDGANTTTSSVSVAVGTSTVSTTLTPTADTYVRDSTFNTTVYGTQGLAVARVSTTSTNNRQTYLKFDLSGLSGSVSSAILKVWGYRSATNDSTFAIAAASMTDNSWDETNTDWNNKPAVGSTINTASVLNTAGAWISIDVSSYIATAKANGQSTISIAIIGAAATSDYFSMSTREGTNPPQLVVTSGATSNAAPTVSTPAAASPSPATGTTTNLSVLGADDGGEGNLTYTWSATANPSGYAPVFSINGTNAAKHTTVTFNHSGNYTFQAQISDGTASTTSIVNVVVNQTLSTIVVTPSVSTLGVGGTQQFSAVGEDQFGRALDSQPVFSWSVPSGCGNVSAIGLYTATSSGSATVRASSGSVNGSGTITVSNAAPTIMTPATASSSPVTGTTANLSVLAGDDGGESHLTYTWSVTNKPTGAADPTYSVNGTNAAKNTTATFNRTGVYSFLLTVYDGSLSTTSSVDVSVSATPTAVTVTPSSAVLSSGASQLFAASVTDQFNNSILDPIVAWSILSGGGTFSGSTYTAGGASTAVIQATSGSATATASITVNNAPPTATVIESTSNVYTNSSTLSFSAQANDPDGNNALLNYDWSVWREGTQLDLGNAPIHATSFSFAPAQDGDYEVRLTVQDAGGASVTATDDFAVGEAGATAANSDNVVARDAGAPITINVLSNDTAPSGDTLSIIHITQGSHGVVSIIDGSPDQVSYVPNSGFTGSDLFTYTIRDRFGETHVGNVNLTILSGGGSTITGGSLAGTQNYAINDGFNVNPDTAFTPETQGNYSYSSNVSSGPSLGTVTDNNGNVESSTTSVAQTLAVISTLTTTGGWTYSEIVTSITTIILAPLVAGKGISQTETKTDNYDFFANGDASASSFSLNATATDSIAGTSTGDSVALEWNSTGEKTAIVTNSTNLVTGASTGNTSQYGMDTYSSTGNGDYSYTISGGAVSGVTTQNSSWGDNYNYGATGGTYVETQANNWSYAGNGDANQETTTSGTLSGSDSGSYSDSDSSDATILEGGGGSSSDTYTLYSVLTGNSWATTGTGISQQDTQGSWTSIGEGSYTHATTSVTGNSTMNGSTNATQTSRWDSDSNLNQVMGADGNWTVSAGRGNSSGTNDSRSSYGGTGSYTQGTTDAGTVSGTPSGSYSNSNHQQGQTNESGESDSTSTYSIQSDWAQGTWTNTGSSGDTETAHGELTSHGTGSYTQATTSATGNNSDSGSLNSSEDSQTDSSTSLAQTLGTDGNWVVTSGTGGSSGDDNASSTYTGTGSYASETTDSGSVSAAGSYDNSDDEQGATDESGNDQSSNSYSIQSNWAGGTWTNTGTSIEGDTEHGEWNSNGTGSYTNITNSQDGRTSLSGSSGTTQHSDWDSDNTVGQELGTDGNWTVSSGTGHSSGTTTSDSSYSGSNGTASYAGSDDTGTLSGSDDDGEDADDSFYDNQDDGSNGSTSENGTTGYTNRYNIQSDWSSGTWVNTGSSHETDEDVGHWSFAGNGHYTHSASGTGGNSSVSGSSNTSQVVNWNSNDAVSQTLGTDGNWSISTGSGSYTGSNDASSRYSGSGTISQNNASPSISVASGTSTHSDFDQKGNVDESGSTDSSSSYAIHSNWSNGSWIQTGSSNETDTSSDLTSSDIEGSYTDSSVNGDNHSNVTGSTGNTQINASNSSYHTSQTLNAGGTWVVTSGSGMNQGDSDTSSTHSGDGDYTLSNTANTGSLSGGGSYNNTVSGQKGDIDESGDTDSSTHYIINDTWSGGTWTPTGSATDNESSDSDYSLDGTGTYSQSTTTADGSANNSNVSGGTDITHSVTSESDSQSNETFVGGSWTVTSGNGDSSGTDETDSSYNGSGSYADGRSISEKGSNTLATDYDIDSTWSNGDDYDYLNDNSEATVGWYPSDGDQSATSVYGGEWSAYTNGNYDQDGVSGTDGSTVASTWNVSATVSMSLALDSDTDPTGTWQVQDGGGDSTGSTRDNWTYSGQGTDDDGNSVTESGDTGTVTSYSVHAGWDNGGGSATHTGTQTTATYDKGSYSLTNSSSDNDDEGNETDTSVTNGRTWDEGTTATQTLGSAGGWIYASTTSKDTYTTIDATSTSVSGTFVGNWYSVPYTVPYTQNDSSVSTQSFTANATLDGSGSTSYDGTGMADTSVSHDYSYSLDGEVSTSNEGSGYTNPNDPEHSSYTYSNSSNENYQGSGSQDSSDDTSTDWSEDSSGSWVASGTTESLSGNSSSDVTGQKATDQYDPMQGPSQSYHQSFTQHRDRQYDATYDDAGDDEGSGQGQATGTETIDQSIQEGNPSIHTEGTYSYSDQWTPGEQASGENDYGTTATITGASAGTSSTYLSSGTDGSPGYSAGQDPIGSPDPSDPVNFGYPGGGTATQQGTPPGPSSPPLKNPAAPAAPASVPATGGGAASEPATPVPAAPSRSWGATIFGAVGVIGGGFEAVGGAVFAAGTAETGIGAVGGVIVAGQGVDSFLTGIRQVYSGQYETPIIPQAVAAGAEELGASRNAANLIGEGVNVGIAVGSLGVGGSALSQAGKITEAEESAQTTQTLYHYTNEAGINGILKDEALNPSLKELNPNDVRYGNGQYLSDIVPGTKTPAQLSRAFLGQPFQGAKFTHYIEIDVTGLNAIEGRPGVFVIPNETALDLLGRIISFGAN